MPIHGIFYARFLPQEGTKIVAQSPPGCIVPVAAADESDNDDFDPAAHWAGNEGGGLPHVHVQDEHVVGGDTVDLDSDSDGDALDIKATRNRRTRKVYKTASAHSDSGAESDAHSARSVQSSTTKRSRAAAASASALLRPANSAASSSVFCRAQLGKPLFDFDVMSEYVIPRPAFFNCYLASRDPSGRYAVLGLPVAIRDSKYDRNEFIFNFGIVVDATTDDQGPYERVVRRLATTFAEMEKQNEFLSREEQRAQRQKAPPGGGGGIGEVLAAGGVTTAANAETTPLDGPLPHAMAGAMGNAAAMSSIGSILGRRRLMTQSPTLGPQGQAQLQGSGANSRTASIGNANASQQGYGFTTGAAAVTMTDHNGHSPYHRRSIQSLLEIIKEDLNVYGECMIPVDDANTINMKLFPIHPNPPAVEGWHVPVPKMRLSDTVDPSWDLTLQRVIAHMDGVSDVRRIAFEADISMELCRSALRHLLYYDTILLLDIFFFGSCYAPRPGIHDFVANVGGIVDECARYVCLGRQDDDTAGGDGTRTPPSAKSSMKSPSKTKSPRSRRTSKAASRERKRRSRRKSRAAASDEEDDSDIEIDNFDDDTEVESHSDDDDDDEDGDDDNESDSSSSRYRRPTRVSNFDLIRLMTSFCVGRTVTEWLKGHSDAGFDVLRFVDVRRLVQFGVIKGCLYRVHKYVVSKQYLASLATGVSAPDADVDEGTDGLDRHDDVRTSSKDPLQKYTDGQHHFDQIMTERNLTEGELVEQLKHMPVPVGDLKIMYR